MKTENYEKYFVFMAKRYSLGEEESDENRILRFKYFVSLAKRYSPLERGTCRLQYDGNADCFPRIVEHILQSKRIPPKYLGFSPRFMVNKFYIINRKSNFLRMEIFLRLFHFCSHSRQKGGGGGVCYNHISERISHFYQIY